MFQNNRQFKSDDGAVCSRIKLPPIRQRPTFVLHKVTPLFELKPVLESLSIKVNIFLIYFN